MNPPILLAAMGKTEEHTVPSNFDKRRKDTIQEECCSEDPWGSGVSFYCYQLK